MEPRTIIVTGGNRGIGAAITAAFVAQGDRVVIAARHRPVQTAESGEHVQFCEMDVREEEGHQRAVAAALAWTGRLDVYINCAGFSAWRPIETVDREFWNQMIGTNLQGTMWGCKMAAAHLSAGGCIINISSLAGKRGSANNAVYCASKFGVNGLTQALAKELGPRNIRVNALCPVYVQTDGLEQALHDPYSPCQGQPVGPFLDAFAQQNAALRRLPTGAEVGAACVMLASPQASALTGQCINVDCGVLPQ